MKTLFVLTGPPDEAGPGYRALREAGARARSGEVKVFLSGEAARCASRGAQRFGAVRDLLDVVVRHGGLVGVCARCMDARGVEPEDLAPGLRPSSFYEFWEWTEWADEVIAL